MFDRLKNYNNCHFHGAFFHPNDLPEIYAKTDLVLSTYDVENENVRFAEPNKIYESIYFRTPIIVSSGTYLAEKVNEIGIGYDIDAMKDEEIINFIQQLDNESINQRISNINCIDKIKAININDEFFERLKVSIE
jgi:glycosyltransferase involved in cell wall biosynthesis